MFDENKSLETILTTTDDAEIGFILEAVLKCRYKLRQKTKFFPNSP